MIIDSQNTSLCILNELFFRSFFTAPSQTLPEFGLIAVHEVESRRSWFY
jgi:hypothetical protein